MRRRNPTPTRPRRLAVAALVMATGVLTGCQKPLFDSSVPRTQFEVHDRMRNRYKPTTIEDEFGRAQPALRERLGQYATSL